MPTIETRTKSLSPMAAVSLFGFASGLPLLLTNSTLQAWMKDSHVDLGLIGLSALIGLPYNLSPCKFPLKIVTQNESWCGFDAS